MFVYVYEMHVCIFAVQDHIQPFSIKQIILAKVVHVLFHFDENKKCVFVRWDKRHTFCAPKYSEENHNSERKNRMLPKERKTVRPLMTIWKGTEVILAIPSQFTRWVIRWRDLNRNEKTIKTSMKICYFIDFSIVWHFHLFGTHRLTLMVTWRFTQMKHLPKCASFIILYFYLKAEVRFAKKKKQKQKQQHFELYEQIHWR